MSGVWEKLQSEGETYFPSKNPQRRETIEMPDVRKDIASKQIELVQQNKNTIMPSVHNAVKLPKIMRDENHNLIPFMKMPS